MAEHAKHRHRAHPHPPPSGARSFWSGTITFGLVSVPVEFFPAHRSGASLRLLDRDGTPLARRYFCPKHRADVHPEHIVRGYELENGEYVLLRDEELEAIEPQKTREIDLRQFVQLSDISPAYYRRAYYLAPAGDTNKAYRLLAAAMQRSQRAGIATFVMHAKEYLVAILAERGILAAITLRFHDELRTPEDVGLPETSRAAARDTAAFRRAIERMWSERLSESDLEARTAGDLRALAEKKWRRGEDVVEAPAAAVAEEPVEDDADDEAVTAGPVDLLEAIRQSLKGGGRDAKASRRPAARRHRKHPNVGDERTDERTKEELYREAQRLGVSGRSEMSKGQLVRAIEKRTRRK